MTEHRRRRDHGFTLPEVLIVVVIMGFLSVAIAGTFSVLVRTLAPTEARADDARTLLGVTVWLPPDVHSTPRVPEAQRNEYWNTDPAAPTGCAGGDVGTNLLRLVWTESIGGTTTYRAAYRLIDEGDHSRIVRVSCVNGTSTGTVNLTGDLPPASTNPITVAHVVRDGEIVGVEMRIRTIEGGTVRVDATSNSRNDTLSPIATLVTSPPAPTTTSTTTTTTLAPTTTVDPSTTTDPDATTTVPTTTVPESTTTTTMACTASIVSISPNPGINQPADKRDQDVGVLQNDVTVTISKNGNCSQLVLQVVMDASKPNPKPDTFVIGDSLQVIFRAGINSERWSDGTRTVSLVETDDGFVHDTDQLGID